MVVKIKSYFKVEVGDVVQVRVHNTLMPQYKFLLQSLLTYGQNYNAYYSQYSVSFQPPSNIYIVLLNQGTVVARLQAKLDNFNEQIGVINTNTCQNNLTSCNLGSITFQLEYRTTDETNDTYTFDEIQIWADNLYAIAYVSIGSITKQPNSFVRVIWDAVVTIESNNVLYIPGCTNSSFTFNTQVPIPNYQPLLCMNIPYIIVALTLIPYDLIPQNTFLYSQLSALLKTLNIFGSGSTPPTQLLNLQGIQYYVIVQSNGNIVYPIHEPFILTNIQQSNTITLFLLYGINNNYFIYTTNITVNIQYFKLYIPTLIINVTDD